MLFFDTRFFLAASPQQTLPSEKTTLFVCVWSIARCLFIRRARGGGGDGARRDAFTERRDDDFFHRSARRSAAE